MTPKEIAASSANILQALGVKLYGPYWGNIMVIAVALSTIATLETSLLQVTRTLFSMGRDGVLPKTFARIHVNWRTPYFASLVVLGVGLVLFVASNLLPSISAVMTDAINAISLQVVFYYALAAITVVVFYRKVLFKTLGNFVFLFLWPAVAAIFLIIVGAADVPSLGPVVDGVGLGLLAVGIIPMLWGHFARRNPFYVGRREVYLPQGQFAAAAVGEVTASTED
jgi:amino acid transporter